jgi:hypothetical protein
MHLGNKKMPQYFGGALVRFTALVRTDLIGDPRFGVGLTSTVVFQE